MHEPGVPAAQQRVGERESLRKLFAVFAFLSFFCIDTWHNYCIRKLNSTTEIDLITKLKIYFAQFIT